MILLRVFALMTSLAATVVADGSLMCSPLKSYPTIMTKCLQSVGISTEEAMKFMPDEDGSIDIKKEDFMEMCGHWNLYFQAGECFRYYTKRCPQDSVDYFKHLYNVVFIVAINCNDDRLNLECFPLLFRNAQGLGTCMDRMKEGWSKNTTRQEEECLTGYDFQNCSFQLLKECDAPTARLFDVFTLLDLHVNNPHCVEVVNEYTRSLQSAE